MPIINVDDLMELSDLFTVVEEPEYSKGKLLSYQEKYGMPSDVFYNYYTQMLGLAKVLNSEELNDWAYNYEIFLEAGGDIWELKKETRLSNEEYRDITFWDSECNLNRQALCEEKLSSFSFLHKCL